MILSKVFSREPLCQAEELDVTGGKTQQEAEDVRHTGRGFRKREGREEKKEEEGRSGHASESDHLGPHAGRSAYWCATSFSEVEPQ